MAIDHVPTYLHLSSEDVEAIADELDTIRRDVEESLGAKDAAYIRRVIYFQRALDISARLLIAGSRSKKGWLLGTGALAYAKSIENMELGHNISPKSTPTPGSGTWWGIRRSGGIRTTTGITCTAMCSVWMRTSATGCCG